MLKWLLIAILNVNILIRFTVNDLSSLLQSPLSPSAEIGSVPSWISLAPHLTPPLSSSLPLTDSIVLYQHSLQPWEISNLEDMKKCFILFGANRDDLISKRHTLFEFHAQGQKGS